MASPSLSALWVQVSCGRWLLTSAPGAGLVRLKLSGASLTVLTKKRPLTQALNSVPAKPRARHQYGVFSFRLLGNCHVVGSATRSAPWAPPAPRLSPHPLPTPL